MSEAEKLARTFHDNYERLAPEFGYKTRDASAVPWDDVPESNRLLMIATAEAILSTGTSHIDLSELPRAEVVVRKAQEIATATAMSGAQALTELVRVIGAERRLPAMVAKFARDWRKSAATLKGEVDSGVVVRQSLESKRSRIQVLESCAEQVEAALRLADA